MTTNATTTDLATRAASFHRSVRGQQLFRRQAEDPEAWKAYADWCGSIGAPACWDTDPEQVPECIGRYLERTARVT